VNWTRLGLAQFGPGKVDFSLLHNKDAVLFPTTIPGPDGSPSLAMIHRPLFPDSASGESQEWGGIQSGKMHPERPGQLHRQPHGSLWISYCPAGSASSKMVFGQHHRLLSPRASWERLKVGAGTPPLLTRHGWLLLYHGVSGTPEHKRLRYSAGAMLLDPQRPHEVIYRSPHPVLSPGIEECRGIVPNVVFPTGMDQRTDLGQPDRIDVYFGMADDRIGVAKMHVPALLARRDAETAEEAAA
jgi:predicted GH43/DUF377 family glycosyl hydrolase